MWAVSGVKYTMSNCFQNGGTPLGWGAVWGALQVAGGAALPHLPCPTPPFSPLQKTNPSKENG